MKIYLTHSTNYDYTAELYQPLQQSSLNDNEIYYPHEKGSEVNKSLDIIKSSDLILAEVSYPSTGQGIELGWADAADIPIICFYRAGSKISGGLYAICSDFIEYNSARDMIDMLESHINRFNK